MNTHEHDSVEEQWASEPDFYGKWQAMDTAPKDGTRIIMFPFLDKTFLGRWSNGFWTTDSGAAVTNVKRWMHNPSDPEET